MGSELPDGIDCDVHPALPGMATLVPFLDPYWQEQVTVRGIDGLDLASFPLRMEAHGRRDWRDGTAKPGSSLEKLCSDALDAFHSRLAICNPLYGASAIYNPYFAAAVAHAINQWIVCEWLDKDPRLRASVTIAADNAEYAVEEIERRADDARFVQVLLLSQGDAPLATVGTGRSMRRPNGTECRSACMRAARSATPSRRTAGLPTTWRIMPRMPSRSRPTC
ncbi:MAG: amidohydrolase family protein [Rhodobacteraceae bacterium]|nr:amidohydrolase family protein [Paracoccaceae bacterium]